MDFEGTDIPVDSIETLITLKEGTGRLQDESDTEHLLRIVLGTRNE